MRKTLMTVIAACVVLGAPGTALAGDNAAVEEYVLDIPGAGGKQHGNDSDGRGGSSAGAGSDLPPGAEAALAAQGEDGAAAAEVAKAGAPKRGADGDGREGGADTRSAQGAGAADTDPEAADSGIAEAVADLAGGSDSGMGPALPILLGLALVGAVILAIRRRGRGTSVDS